MKSAFAIVLVLFLLNYTGFTISCYEIFRGGSVCDKVCSVIGYVFVNAFFVYFALLVFKNSKIEANE